MSNSRILWFLDINAAAYCPPAVQQTNFWPYSVIVQIHIIKWESYLCKFILPNELKYFQKKINRGEISIWGMRIVSVSVFLMTKITQNDEKSFIKLRLSVNRRQSFHRTSRKNMMRLFRREQKVVIIDGSKWVLEWVHWWKRELPESSFFLA